MYATLVLLVLTLSAQMAEESFCACTSVAASTHPGGNEEVVVYATDAVAEIDGVVRGPGDVGLDGVLVVVLASPEHGDDVYLLSNGDLTGWRRVAACETSSNGCFRFETLPDGAYALRMSKAGGWNVLTVVIDVKRGAAMQRPLEYGLTLAT